MPKKAGIWPSCCAASSGSPMTSVGPKLYEHPPSFDCVPNKNVWFAVKALLTCSHERTRKKRLPCSTLMHSSTTKD